MVPSTLTNWNCFSWPTGFCMISYYISVLFTQHISTQAHICILVPYSWFFHCLFFWGTKVLFLGWGFVALIIFSKGVLWPNCKLGIIGLFKISSINVMSEVSWVWTLKSFRKWVLRQLIWLFIVFFSLALLWLDNWSLNMWISSCIISPLVGCVTAIRILVWTFLSSESVY